MKKILFVMIAMLSAVAVWAGDKYSRNVNDLPQAARTTLTRYFKAEVSVIKIETTMGHVDEYEVVLTDGTEINFDNKGNWKDIEVRRGSKVPDAFVPEAMLAYIKKYQGKEKVVGIEKKRSGYEVQLENGVEMKFDKSGNFKGYDD
ncbi:MAG: PepSY-like domain-containing protein [Bacteroides sp.]|nr:PepSY-like domain-containing protein [Bacteroides sp.]MCM1413403.1 PepSY-like domain-containing protein [Bacteroides sp.]MCM1471911.1 PepSY-like domain-containing protein [Bacteroides sp.]